MVEKSSGEPSVSLKASRSTPGAERRNGETENTHQVSAIEVHPLRYPINTCTNNNSRHPGASARAAFVRLNRPKPTVHCGGISIYYPPSRCGLWLQRHPLRAIMRPDATMQDVHARDCSFFASLFAVVAAEHSHLPDSRASTRARWSRHMWSLVRFAIATYPSVTLSGAVRRARSGMQPRVFAPLPNG